MSIDFFFIIILEKIYIKKEKGKKKLPQLLAIFNKVIQSDRCDSLIHQTIILCLKSHSVRDDRQFEWKSGHVPCM
jgi:hypothetical protein